jgi:hypothetical protein
LALTFLSVISNCSYPYLRNSSLMGTVIVVCVSPVAIVPLQLVAV